MVEATSPTIIGGTLPALAQLGSDQAEVAFVRGGREYQALVQRDANGEWQFVNQDDANLRNLYIEVEGTRLTVRERRPLAADRRLTTAVIETRFDNLSGSSIDQILFNLGIGLTAVETITADGIVEVDEVRRVGGVGINEAVLREINVDGYTGNQVLSDEELRRFDAQVQSYAGIFRIDIHEAYELFRTASSFRGVNPEALIEARDEMRGDIAARLDQAHYRTLTSADARRDYVRQALLDTRDGHSYPAAVVDAALAHVDFSDGGLVDAIATQLSYNLIQIAEASRQGQTFNGFEPYRPEGDDAEMPPLHTARAIICFLQGRDVEEPAYVSEGGVEVAAGPTGGTPATPGTPATAAETAQPRLSWRTAARQLSRLPGLRDDLYNVLAYRNRDNWRERASQMAQRLMAQGHADIAEALPEILAHYGGSTYRGLESESDYHYWMAVGYLGRGEAVTQTTARQIEQAIAHGRQASAERRPDLMRMILDRCERSTQMSALERAQLRFDILSHDYTGNDLRERLNQLMQECRASVESDEMRHLAVQIMDFMMYNGRVTLDRLPGATEADRLALARSLEAAGYLQDHPAPADRSQSEYWTVVEGADLSRLSELTIEDAWINGFTTQAERRDYQIEVATEGPDRTPPNEACLTARRTAMRDTIRETLEGVAANADGLGLGRTFAIPNPNGQGTISLGALRAQTRQEQLVPIDIARITASAISPEDVLIPEGVTAARTQLSQIFVQAIETRGRILREAGGGPLSTEQQGAFHDAVVQIAYAATALGRIYTALARQATSQASGQDIHGPQGTDQFELENEAAEFNQIATAAFQALLGLARDGLITAEEQSAYRQGAFDANNAIAETIFIHSREWERGTTAGGRRSRYQADWLRGYRAQAERLDHSLLVENPTPRDRPDPQQRRQEFIEVSMYNNMILYQFDITESPIDPLDRTHVLDVLGRAGGTVDRVLQYVAPTAPTGTRRGAAATSMTDGEVQALVDRAQPIMTTLPEDTHATIVSEQLRPMLTLYHDLEDARRRIPQGNPLRTSVDPLFTRLSSYDSVTQAVAREQRQARLVDLGHQIRDFNNASRTPLSADDAVRLNGIRTGLQTALAPWTAPADRTAIFAAAGLRESDVTSLLGPEIHFEAPQGEASSVGSSVTSQQVDAALAEAQALLPGVTDSQRRETYRDRLERAHALDTGTQEGRQQAFDTIRQITSELPHPFGSQISLDTPDGRGASYSLRVLYNALNSWGDSTDISATAELLRTAARRLGLIAAVPDLSSYDGACTRIAGLRDRASARRQLIAGYNRLAGVAGALRLSTGSSERRAEVAAADPPSPGPIQPPATPTGASSGALPAYTITGDSDRMFRTMYALLLSRHGTNTRTISGVQYTYDWSRQPDRMTLRAGLGAWWRGHPGLHDGLTQGNPPTGPAPLPDIEYELRSTQ